MTVSEKIKTIDNTIKQNKVQNDLYRQTAMISALSSGKVGKYKFLTSKDVLPEKDFLEKAVAIKKFEYLPLGSELKKQTDIAKKQYQGSQKVYEFYKKGNDKTISKDDKKPTLKKCKKSDLIYDSKHSFHDYNNIINLRRLSLIQNNTFLFYQDLNKLNRVKSKKENTKKKKRFYITKLQNCIMSF